MSKILNTSDYTKFNRIRGNRKVNKAHVNKLTTALSEDPKAIEYNPILVNEKYEIIDGQHRFEAAKRLELPIHYQMVKGLDLMTVQKLNTNSKVWSPKDYAIAYEELGKSDYTLYLKHKEKYGLNHEVTISYVGVGESNTPGSFKRGAFKAGDQKVCEEMTQLLLDIGKYVDHNRSRTTATAFLKVALNENYNHERMMDKLSKYGPQMELNSTLLDAIRSFETIYNSGLREGNQVRFY